MTMTILQNTTFIRRCISDTLAGLREGLSRFSGTSRSAVIFCIHADDALQICDPQSLLRGHEPRLKTTFLDEQNWRRESNRRYERKFFGHLDVDNSLHLDGMICYGGSSGTVFYQLWLTEHHPDMCSTGPTERWLEHAALRFSHDIANESDLYTGISGSFLREYATHAVHDYIVDRANISLGPDTLVHIYPVLESVLGISKTTEEGESPCGELIFVEPRFIPHIHFIARFRPDQQPRLDHFKYVRKLLQSVEYSENKLVSDGINIIGICNRRMPDFCLVADFQGKIGFLRLNEEPVCSFEDGSYRSTTHRAKLYEVEEILLDFDLDVSTRNSLFRIVSSLVHNAENKKFGCTLVIELGQTSTAISGQVLDPPINLQHSEQLELACGLAKMDGALHIRSDLHLHGFACLLDGLSISGEDRSRGARYNSALRFTHVRPETIVVVVSSDHPVSVIHLGEEVRKRNKGNSLSLCSLYPEPLTHWLDAGL
jgi:hypothetical protein